jgi:hypothetical protein
MAHDVFISHSSIDKPTADAIVALLEANGIRCWIAPRDILPGSDWSESIMEAMEQAGTMVLVFSAHSNTSPQIRREIESAVSAGIPVIPFRIEDVLPSKSLQYFIGPQHWLDAWTPPLEQHLHRLTATIKALLSKRIEGFDAAGKEPRLKPQTDTAAATFGAASAEPPPAAAGAETSVETAPGPPVRKFAWTMVLILAGFMAAATFGGGAVWWLSYQRGAPQSAQAPAAPLKQGELKGAEPKAPAKPSGQESTAKEKLSNEEPESRQSISGKRRIYIRIFNIDDIGRAYVNGTLLKEVAYSGDTKDIDITNKLLKGRNIFRFTLINNHGGWAYGFMVKRNEEIMWKMECGKAGYIGCNDNDQTLGLVFDKVIYIDNLLD